MVYVSSTDAHDDVAPTTDMPRVDTRDLEIGGAADDTSSDAGTDDGAGGAGGGGAHPHRITDPRIIASLAITWCAILVVIYYLAGGTRADNGYILWNIGPSPNLFFIGVAIDTWTMWVLFNLLVLADSAINVVVIEVILTWLTLEIYDRSKVVVRWGATEVNPQCAVLVALAYNVYNSIHWLFWLYLALTQADTQLIIILVNAMCTVLVVRACMRDKQRAAAAAASPATTTTTTTWKSSAAAGPSSSSKTCFGRCWARLTTTEEAPGRRGPVSSTTTELAAVARQRSQEQRRLLAARKQYATEPPELKVVPVRFEEEEDR